MAPAVKPLLLKEGAWLGGLGGIVAVHDLIGSVFGLLTVLLCFGAAAIRFCLALEERKRAREEAERE